MASLLTSLNDPAISSGEQPRPRGASPSRLRQLIWGPSLIFGTQKFGWVDEVEGLGSVATLFIHVMYVPLIPTGSYFIFSDDSDRGVAIPLNGKSVLIAYTRAVMFWTALICTVAALVSTGLTCCCAIPAWGIYVAMPFVLRPASPERADELRAMLVSKMDVG